MNIFFHRKVIVIAVFVLALVATFATGVSSKSERQAAADQVPYPVLRACYHDALNNLFAH